MRIFTELDIIDATCELLGTYSIDDLTVQQIVDRCGISRSTFYNYFDDKYAVIEVIYEWQRRETLSSVDNLYGLSAIFRVAINENLVPKRNNTFIKVSIRSAGGL